MTHLCLTHMPEGWPDNGHVLVSPAGCTIRHDDCTCGGDFPHYLRHGCPQHMPYRRDYCE